MPRKPVKQKAFATEVELCAAFIEHLPEGWVSYNEHDGWDILLVRKSDGFQIGVEAKLKLNAAVVKQAIEDGVEWRATIEGPDCRAVLVPADEAGPFDAICAYIGITIIRMHVGGRSRLGYGNGPFSPELPEAKGKWRNNKWFECAPAKRHALPEYVPDVPAGAPAPLQLTDWKIKAIKIAVTLKKRGYVTRHDFKHIGIDYRRWIAPGYEWLLVKDGAYVAGRCLPDFKAQHPKVWDQIEADAGKWMATDGGMRVQPQLV